MIKKQRGVLASFLIALLAGLGINLAIGLFLGFEDLFSSFQGADAALVAVPFACYFLIYVVDSLRLKLVLPEFRKVLGWKEGFFNSVAASFFSNLRPPAAGKLAFPIYHLTRLGVNSKLAARVNLTRRSVYLAICLFLSLAGLPVAFRLARTIRAAGGLLYLGLAVSAGLGFLCLVLLVRPGLPARLALALDRSSLGGLFNRLFHAKDWARRFGAWTRKVRREAAFLWSERIAVLLADFSLALVNLGLQAYSLLFVLQRFLRYDAAFAQILVVFVVLNFVFYYVPTPGASGSVEGVYAWVLSGMTGTPGPALAAIIVWRFATYYLHILFGFLVFMLRPKKLAMAIPFFDGLGGKT